MRIGIVINSSWNIYNFRQGLIKQLLSDGHEVAAIAPDDGFGEKITTLGCQFYHLPMATKGTNPIQDMALSYRLYQLYKNLDLDVAMHFTIKPNLYGTFAAHLAGIPSVNNVTGLGTVFLHKNLTSKIGRFLYRFVFRYPKKVLFQNEDDRSLFVESKLVRAHITDLLPGSGVNLAHFYYTPLAERKYMTFLMISRLLTDKGVQEYMDAAKALAGQGHRFQLLGPEEPHAKLGVSLEKIQSYAREGFIEYLGETNDVRPYIAAADCIVLPSYREGTPRSLIEAASMGRPLIATNVPGCREVVRHGENGLLCEVKNKESLAASMQALAAMDYPKRLAMGQRSHALAVEKFDESFVIEKYYKAISACMPHMPIHFEVKMAPSATF
jgi:glycosyltransferase involved in cell wall biosynthesis